MSAINLIEVPNIFVLFLYFQLDDVYNSC